MAVLFLFGDNTSGAIWWSTLHFGNDSFLCFSLVSP